MPSFSIEISNMPLYLIELQNCPWCRICVKVFVFSYQIWKREGIFFFHAFFCFPRQTLFSAQLHFITPISLSLSLHANKENCHGQFSLPLSTTLLPSPWPNQLNLPSSNLHPKNQIFLLLIFTQAIAITSILNFLLIIRFGVFLHLHRRYLHHSFAFRL